MEFRLLAKSLLMPPLLQLLLIVLGALFYRRLPRIAKSCWWIGLISLWCFSTPWFAASLAQITQRAPALSLQMLESTKAQAIVVLTAGQKTATPEYGAPVSSREGQLRARYGAYLHRVTGLPILLSGGSVYGDDRQSLAKTMAFDMQQAFNVPVTWLEERSRTTQENAYYSYKILQNEKKTNIVLVTSAIHMARAAYLFEREGFVVEPAPTAFAEKLPFKLRYLLPDAESLFLSHGVLHEALGNIWVRIF
ncbi:uncharacterized SAM-binding protein YcdF (DUF218 family) [Alteromonadaceae bacterium 2753L.S.0a.02]|nr:uncharacterized SAM-binding protein YcdF (DUF218 family) [Alteromonadaceae bacterium 2753L.S.0a.02]